jgi:hypothetical protein
MRTIYIKVEKNGIIRKISLDMAYLSAHKKIRLPKYYFEDGLFLDYKELGNNSDFKKLFLTRDKIKKEDSDFYYFEFPFKLEQVFDIAV